MRTSFSSVIVKYIELLAEETKTSMGFNLIFRGHPDSSWELASSANRRIAYDDSLNNSTTKIDKERFIDYNLKLILRAREYGYGKELKDLELLAEIQHNGGATCLLDFTTNFLVALWFASSNMNTDGMVFIIDKRDVFFNKIKDIERDFCGILHSSSGLKSNSDVLYIWKPTKIINRIYHQDSVFVFGYPSLSNEHYKTIKINQNDKIEIRKELKKFFKIDPETIFGDINGFAFHANGHHTPLNDYNYLNCYEVADSYENNNDYINALKYFNRIPDCEKNRPWCASKQSKCLGSSVKNDDLQYRILLCHAFLAKKALESDLNANIEDILLILDNANHSKIKYAYTTIINCFYEGKPKKAMELCIRALDQHNRDCSAFIFSIIELSIMLNDKTTYGIYKDRMLRHKTTHWYNSLLANFFDIIANVYFHNTNTADYTNVLPTEQRLIPKEHYWGFYDLTQWCKKLKDENQKRFIEKLIKEMEEYQEAHIKS